MSDLATFERFCAETLRVEDGSPMVVEPFQRLLLTDYFDGVRETVALLPKKQGKSSLIAALAIFHLLSTPDAEVVIGAASRDQAGILASQAEGLISRSPGLLDLLELRPGYRQIRNRRDRGRIRVLAADATTSDGVLPTLAVCDELHRHRSGDLYGVFRDGLGARGGQMITISTAGSADDERGPLGALRRAAYALPGLRRDGAHTYARGEHFAMHEWSLTPDDDPDDLDVVKLANPASWQTVEELRKRHDSPSMTRTAWLRFACGLWVGMDDAAVNAQDWAACAEGWAPIPDGAEIRVGVDLGWTRDCTALVPHMLTDGVGVVGRPVILTPPGDGRALPKSEVIAELLKLARRYELRAVVLDPMAGGEVLAQDLEAEGIEVVAHAQTPAAMALAASRLLEAIRERRLLHPDDPELNAHVLAGALKAAGGETYRFVKGRGGRPIDALIALAIVHSAAIGEPPPKEPEFLFAWA